MNEIKEKIEELDEIGAQYVWEKARNMGHSITSVCKSIGVSRTKFYEDYDEAGRSYLDTLARELFEQTQYLTLSTIDESAHKAAEKLIELMNNARSEYVQMQAAQSLLAYALGNPVNRTDITSGGEQLKVNIVYGDADANDYA